MKKCYLKQSELTFSFKIIFTEPAAPRFSTRRKSVFAEAYDPENDADDDEGATAIFPKSDEQRARLVESVKNVLLFRSLEKEQASFIPRTKSLESLIQIIIISDESSTGCHVRKKGIAR